MARSRFTKLLLGAIFKNDAGKGARRGRWDEEALPRTAGAGQGGGEPGLASEK